MQTFKVYEAWIHYCQRTTFHTVRAETEAEAIEIAKTMDIEFIDREGDSFEDLYGIGTDEEAACEASDAKYQAVREIVAKLAGFSEDDFDGDDAVIDWINDLARKARSTADYT